MRERSGSIAAGVVVLVALACLLLPLPTVVIDFLLAANLTGAVLLLVTAATARRPSELGSLPQWLVAASLARLVLAVSTVRLILLQGQAGRVIDGFGKFVVRGDYVVGLCIFIVLGLVQYLVLARGGERIAEVAARFALDAMPGQQLALDAEVRAGQVSPVDAQRQRRALVGDAQLFGSLDGAMRFVRGDTIAGFIVLALALVAGLLLGVWRDGLTFADAAKRYTLLTIGDGLVTQLPSLMVTAAATLLVSRSADRAVNATPLDEILRPRAVFAAAAVALGLGLVPGLPLWPFALIGLGLAALGAWLISPRRAQAQTRSDDIVVRLPATFATSQRAAVDAIDAAVARLSVDVGVAIPPVQVRVDATLEADRFVVDLGGIDVAGGELRKNAVLVDVAPAALPPGIAGEPATHPRGQTLGSWIAADNAAALGHVEALASVDVIARVVENALRASLQQFVTIETTHAQLAALAKTHPNLVREVVPRRFDVPLLAEILRRLVREGLSVRRLDELFEAAASLRDEPRDADKWAEQLRLAAATRRQITARYAIARNVDALLLDAEAEELLRDSLRPGGAGVEVALEPELHDALLESVGQSLDASRRTVVVTPTDLRRHVRRLLEEKYPGLPVIAFGELLPDVQISAIGNLSLRS